LLAMDHGKHYGMLYVEPYHLMLKGLISCDGIQLTHTESRFGCLGICPERYKVLIQKNCSYFWNQKLCTSFL
jgi:hypothetical protein